MNNNERSCLQWEQLEHSRRSRPAEPVHMLEATVPQAGYKPTKVCKGCDYSSCAAFAHIPPFDGIRKILKGGGNPLYALADSGQQFAGATIKC